MKTNTAEEVKVIVNTACRVCAGRRLQLVLQLGPTALANSFLSPQDLGHEEPSYPLDVYSCEDCGLLQLIHVVPPEVLFRDYIYVSTTSDTLQTHFGELASTLSERYSLDAQSLVVEIASNDGLLLKKFRALGIRGLGVEPAINIADIARQDGLDVVNDFFCEETARRIRQEHGPADVICGNNVLAHVDNLKSFLRGIELLLKPGGGVSIEVPYLRDLIERKEYDTIYHEHLSYFSAAVLTRLFARHGLKVYDVERVAIHGGSLRVHAQKAESGAVETGRLQAILAEEEKIGLNHPSFHKQFAAEVTRLKTELIAILEDLRAEGKRIAAYGAPAKGNTQLNYCRIGTDLVKYTVDKSRLKQGKLTPGMHLPVYPVEKLLEDQPDYVLILAWNFVDEILRQQAEYLRRGGKFIIPIPKPCIVSSSGASPSFH